MKVKKKSSTFTYLLSLILILDSFSSMTTVHPKVDSSSILTNPYMGFQISFNIEADYYPFSTYYLRASGSCGDYSFSGLNWATLNPESGVFDFSQVKNLVECLKENGLYGHLRMRNVIGHNDEPSVPEYLKDKIPVSNGLGNDGSEQGMEIEYYNCEFLQHWEELVDGLRDAIGDERCINMIDIGSIGWFGEWCNAKMVRNILSSSQIYDENKANALVSVETAKRVIHMFTGGRGNAMCLDSEGKMKDVKYEYEGFKEQFIFINRCNELYPLKIGMEQSGAGFRFDSVAYFSSENEYSSWEPLFYDIMKDYWKEVPFSGEFANLVDVSEYWEKSLCQAKAWHLSSVHVNHYEKPLPESNYLEYFKLLGYRIETEEITYENEVSAGISFSLAITLKNTGTSPAYKKYPLFVYLKQDMDEDPLFCQKFDEEVDLRLVHPASVLNLTYNYKVCEMGEIEPLTFTVQVFVPEWIAAGEYYLYFAFLEDTYSSPIEFALEDKDSGGRYLIGSIHVTGDGSGKAPDDEQCVEEISYISIDQEKNRLALEDEVFDRFVFYPVKDWYAYKYGESTDDKIGVKNDYLEGFIMFDLREMEKLDIERVDSISIFLMPWYSGTWSASYYYDIFADEWEIGFGWDDRPSKKDLNITSTGEYVYCGKDSIEIELSDIEISSILKMDRNFSIYLHAKDITEKEGSFASSRYINGLNSPYMIINVKIDDDNDDENDDKDSDDDENCSVGKFFFDVFFLLSLVVTFFF